VGSGIPVEELDILIRKTHTQLHTGVLPPVRPVATEAPQPGPQRVSQLEVAQAEPGSVWLSMACLTVAYFFAVSRRTIIRRSGEKTDVSPSA
jgi:hypothetical protein